MGWLDKIRGSLLAERERWILWLPVLLALGIGGYFALPAQPPLWAGGVVLAVAIGYAAALLAWSGGRYMALAILTIACGFALASLRTEWVRAPMLVEPLHIATLTGQVREANAIPSGGVKLQLDHVAIEGLAPADTPLAANVTLRKLDTPVHPGDRVSLRAGLFPPPSPVAPGEYDFGRMYYFKHIGAVGFGLPPVTVTPAPARAAWVPHGADAWLAELRAKLSSLMQNLLGPRTGPVATALLIGDTSAIPDDIQNDMRVAGLYHLLAVSGMNLALVSGIVFFLVRLVIAAIPPLALRIDPKKWAALAALAATYFYLVLTGAPVSAQRAFVMIALLFGAVLLDRTPTPMRSLSFAALIVLLWAPESLLNAGFQLSFAATLALIAFYETWSDHLQQFRRRGGWWRLPAFYLLGIFTSSLAAGLGTMPFLVHHFRQFSTYTLLANMLASPIVAFWITPMQVLAFLLLPFKLAGPAFYAMGWGIDAMLWVAHRIATLPQAQLHPPTLTWWGLALLALGGCWLCLWRTRWRLLGMAPIAAGLATMLLWAPPDILVSDDGKLIAARINDSLTLIKGTGRNFTAKNWLQHEGQDAFAEPQPPAVRCDALACRIQKNGAIASAVLRRDALAEDCPLSQIVIAEFTLQSGNCPGTPERVGRRELEMGGAHAIWLKPGRAIVRSVREAQGEWPWTHHSSPARDY